MNKKIEDIEAEFTLREAIDLLNCHVVTKENANKANYSIEEIAFVAGIITLNDEIEVLVKSANGLIQLNKIDFHQKMSLLEMP